LLKLPAQHSVEVVAIALDTGWADVDRFLGGADASSVVLIEGQAERHSLTRALDVRRLPATFLVQAGGRITRRFDGARDWTDKVFVKAWIP
jgi:hypothetical protein